ncbi:hypothetical protein CQA40_02440 [Helicobacter sp. MIT 01-3238]|nr:hypothetical protein CQA40_02440 [Helicobacter sp. MIT 01-3238]
MWLGRSIYVVLVVLFCWLWYLADNSRAKIIMLIKAIYTAFIYGIILLLCLFSLQKSARKNSIIPA